MPIEELVQNDGYDIPLPLSSNADDSTKPAFKEAANFFPFSVGTTTWSLRSILFPTIVNAIEQL